MVSWVSSLLARLEVERIDHHHLFCANKITTLESAELLTYNSVIVSSPEDKDVANATTNTSKNGPRSK